MTASFIKSPRIRLAALPLSALLAGSVLLASCTDPGNRGVGPVAMQDTELGGVPDQGPGQGLKYLPEQPPYCDEECAAERAQAERRRSREASSNFLGGLSMVTAIAGGALAGATGNYGAMAMATASAQAMSSRSRVDDEDDEAFSSTPSGSPSGDMRSSASGGDAAAAGCAPGPKCLRASERQKPIFAKLKRQLDNAGGAAHAAALDYCNKWLMEELSRTCANEQAKMGKQVCANAAYAQMEEFTRSAEGSRQSVEAFSTGGFPGGMQSCRKYL